MTPTERLRVALGKVCGTYREIEGRFRFILRGQGWEIWRMEEWWLASKEGANHGFFAKDPVDLIQHIRTQARQQEQLANKGGGGSERNREMR